MCKVQRACLLLLSLGITQPFAALAQEAPAESVLKTVEDLQPQMQSAGEGEVKIAIETATAPKPSEESGSATAGEESLQEVFTPSLSSDAIKRYLSSHEQVSMQTTLRCAALLLFASGLVFGGIWMRSRDLLGEILLFKMVALTLVITSGLVLIVAGFSSDQITSMMGLLGTVAGYVLGKSEDERR
jgi:hypothetical protein